MASTLSKSQFERITRIAHDRWGLSISARKRDMVGNRFASYIRKSRFSTIDEVLDSVERCPSREDLLALFDVLSTHTTRFFREPAHFAYVERELLTPMARGTLSFPSRRVRIWSAACSTGCEPCSLAISAIETLGDLSNWDLRILATDLSSSALRAARSGEYPAEQASELSAERRGRFFTRTDNPERLRVVPEVRDLISYRRLNLMDDWPFSGPFHVIFCCNVMIYFDEGARRRLVERLYDVLAPGGILAVGSAEAINGLGTRFRRVQANLYRK